MQEWGCRLKIMSDSTARELFVLLESISAQARNGLAFSDNAFDVGRYQEILAALERIIRLLSREGALDNVLSNWSSAQPGIPNQQYVTPKIAVSAVTFNSSDDVMLVKRTDKLWTLPGGYADVGFDPVQNAEKEVREETGLEIKVISLIGVYDSNITRFPTIGSQVYTLAFYAELVGGELKADPLETKGAAFFALHALPEAAPGTFAQVERAFRLSKGDLLPAVFDHRELN